MRIAVLLPAYNPNKQWIDKAILSVLNQETSHSIDLFIWLDGDGDYIPPSLERVHFLKDTTRRGLSGGLNYMFSNIIGLSWANKYDYFARIDADDVWHKDKIQHQVDYMNANELSVCGTWGVLIHGDGSIRDEKWSYANWESDIHLMFMKEPTADFFIDPSVMFNSKIVYDGLIHYNNAMLGGADYELWLRLAAMNIKMGSVPERLYLYRMHSEVQNTRSEQWRKTMDACSQRITQMYKLLNTNVSYFVKNKDCI